MFEEMVRVDNSSLFRATKIYGFNAWNCSLSLFEQSSTRENLNPAKWELKRFIFQMNSSLIF